MLETVFGGRQRRSLVVAEVHSSPGWLFKYLIPHGGEACGQEEGHSPAPWE